MRRVRHEKLAAALLFGAAVLAATPVVSAAASGIRGRVVDRQGDPVPGATVTLTDLATLRTVGLASDENGRFESPALAAGNVLVEASFPGAETVARAEVDLPSDRVVSIELRLDLDMVHESAVVVGSAPRSSVESRAIRESFARDAGESLARVPGMARVRKGAIANDVVLRSFKGENLSVTIDGARLHGACPGKMDPPAFHVDFAEIERIEIERGPFDVTASGALGGSVDIVTRRPAAGWHGGFQLGLGSFGVLAPSASGGFGGEDWSIHGGASSRRQDPYRDGEGLLFTERTNYRPDEREARAYDVVTGWGGATAGVAPGHRLEFQAALQRADAALYPYLQMDAVFDDADRFRVAYTGQSPFAGIDLLQAAASYVVVDHWMTDARRTSSVGRPRGWGMATLAGSSVGEVEVEVLRGPWRAGAEAYRRNWTATTTLWSMPLQTYRDQASLPDVDTTSAGLFAAYERSIGSELELALGARVDRAETAASEGLANTGLYQAFHGTRSTRRADTLPGGSATLRWHPDGAWELFAGLGYRTRVPSAEERYYALQRMGTSWVGNPELDPPRNAELDLGVSFGGTRLHAEGSLFWSRVADFVTVHEQPLQNAVPGVATPSAKSYANVDAGIRGGELAVSVAATSRLSVTLGAWVTRGRQDPDPSRNIRSVYLPEMPPLTGRVEARYEAPSWFLEGAWIAAAAQDEVNADLQETPTPGWGIVNLRGGFSAGPFSLVAGIDNLFDKLYRESLSYARDPFRSGAPVYEPGRSASLSLLLRY